MLENNDSKSKLPINKLDLVLIFCLKNKANLYPNLKQSLSEYSLMVLRIGTRNLASLCVGAIKENMMSLRGGQPSTYSL